MTITDELNEIIIKYTLDRYYPRFRKKVYADKIVKKIFEEEFKNNHTVLLLGSSQKDINYTKRLIRNYSYIKTYIIDETDYSRFTYKDLPQVDSIYLISYHGLEFLITLLEKEGIEYINLYDIFLSNELIFDDEYYRFLTEEYNIFFGKECFPRVHEWKEQIVLEYYFQYRRYKKSKELDIKKIALEKMIFLCLYLKNFVELRKCLLEMQNLEKNLNYIKIWEEVTKILDNIRNVISKRKQKDIVLYWIDALNFEDDWSYMYYLNKIQDESVSFQEAFTVTPYTMPTFYSLFCQKKLITDKTYKMNSLDASTSQVISYLENKGYNIKIITGRKDIGGYAGISRAGICDPASLVLWNMLECMMEEEKPLFIMAHLLLETHKPWVSVKMDYLDSISQRKKWGKQELDEQLAFYDSMLGKQTVRIFMSDHGQDNFRSLLHIHMHVYNVKFQPRKIDNLFSILDFYLLLKQIVEKDDIEEDVFKREFVPIENLDWYSTNDIKNNDLNLLKFGFKGLITKDEIYMRFSIGKEWLTKRKVDGGEALLWLESEIEDNTNLEKFRSLVEKYPIEIYKEPYFENSKYWRVLYERYIQKKNNLFNCVNEILQSYNYNSIVIRMGGQHSYNLYRILSEENKDKVIAFVDENPNCICASYEKEIWTLEQMKERKIRGVLLSSYIYQETLRQESVDYPKEVEVLDLYKIFEKKGFRIKGNFYESIEMKEEDYEWVIQKVEKDSK